MCHNLRTLGPSQKSMSISHVFLSTPEKDCVRAKLFASFAYKAQNIKSLAGSSYFYSVENDAINFLKFVVKE